MAVKKSISEWNFQEFARCPLRVNGESSYAESEELEMAKACLKRVMLTAWDKALCLHEIRALLEKENDKPSLRAAIPRIARRLSQLVSGLEVMQTVTPYTLQFARLAVTGEYGVAAHPRKPHEMLLIRLRSEIGPRSYPDLVSACRWLHFSNYEHGKTAKILNYSITQDREYVETYHEERLREHLHGLAASITDDRTFPVAGPHCASCQTESCLEAMRCLTR